MAGAAYDRSYDKTENGSCKGSDNADCFTERERVGYKVTDKEHHERQNIYRKRTLNNALCRRLYHDMLAAVRTYGIAHDRLHKIFIAAFSALTAIASAYTEAFNDDLGKAVITDISYYCFLKHHSSPLWIIHLNMPCRKSVFMLYCSM